MADKSLVQPFSAVSTDLIARTLPFTSPSFSLYRNLLTEMAIACPRQLCPQQGRW